MSDNLIRGKCPACGGHSLFGGSGGYVTCSRDVCTDPTLVSDLLEWPIYEMRSSGIDPQKLLDYANAARMANAHTVTISNTELAIIARALGAKDE